MKLLLVPGTCCRVVALGNKPPLGTKVTLRMVLALETSILTGLEANFVLLVQPMGVGSEGVAVAVALLPSYGGMAELMEWAGEWAGGVSVLGDMWSLCDVTGMHNTDRWLVLMVELAVRHGGRDSEVFWQRHLNLATKRGNENWAERECSWLKQPKNVSNVWLFKTFFQEQTKCVQIS